MDSENKDKQPNRGRFEKQIGQFEIMELLGEGGLGRVYLAKDSKLNRKVALKFIITADITEEELSGLFKNEIQALALAENPNIVTIYEAGVHNNTPYIVMEYIEGKPLKELIKEGSISTTDAITYCIEICKGLEKAHTLGLVHRDINPKNIIISKDGFVKIADFGLAKVIGKRGISEITSYAGTINYLSPEQINGDVLDHRSDIFSLGVVLYELLTGKMPFRGEYEAATTYSIQNVDPEPLAKYNADLPSSLQTIIDKALQKKPAKRYASLGDMADDLRKVLIHDLAGKAGQPKQGQNSIAVLNFADMSPEKDQEFFCDGVAEEIISTLTKLENIKVVSRSSSFQFKGRDYDSRMIGKKLGVSSVLEGSVRKAGDRVRINVQLLDVDDGFYVWSEKYDSQLSDIFAIQDEISKAIVDKLKIKAETDRDRPLVRKPTRNVDAYNEYLRGRYYWNRRYEGGLQKSIEYFQTAISLDPLYASAYAGMADSFNIIGFYNFMPPHEACTRAKAAAARALELDPNLAESHTAMGWVKAFYDWDWKAAEAEHRRALELNNTYAVAHHYYALFLLAMQRFEEAFHEMKIALNLDPLAPIISTSLAAAYYFNRQYDEAIKQYLKTLDFEPDFAIAHAFLGGPYVCQQKFDKATYECKRACELSGGSNYPYAFLAYVYGISGNILEAEKMLTEMIERSRREYISSYHIALIYCGMGEFEKSLDWLEKAYEERDNWMIWLNIYPVFDPLRKHPRFISLLEKVGLKN